MDISTVSFCTDSRKPGNVPREIECIFIACSFFYKECGVCDIYFRLSESVNPSPFVKPVGLLMVFTRTHHTYSHPVSCKISSSILPSTRGCPGSCLRLMFSI
jgi:hypothetical protein